ncbi:class I SAM-dependent methyltransferase [soil metagenome]
MKQVEIGLGKCRFCHAPLHKTFVDLGMSPLCEDLIKAEQLNKMEPFYPLHVFVCTNCLLVQVEELVSPEVIYRDYAYFSSYSDSWLAHSKQYADDIVNRFSLSEKHLIVELASNDGYLLQYFKRKKLQVLGIEPAAKVATHARGKGIPTEIKFFGKKCVDELIARYGKAYLLIGNNVLAHVPEINDFVSSMKKFLQPTGIITMEFPHLLKLIEGNQFDTIYHEHYSYLSFAVVEKIFNAHGLVLFDVEELATHGGSLRIYGKHKEDITRTTDERVARLREKELAAGMNSLSYYEGFNERVKKTKWNVLEFLISARRDGKSVVGYGAPGKGNTLLNYCGVRTDLIDYTVDRNPHKQNSYLPGTLIPIFSPARIAETKPDFVFILPWNLKNEIMANLSYIGQWGGKFVVPIPEIEIYDSQTVPAIA